MEVQETQVSTKYKQGTLLKQSEILKSWNKRWILLNFINKTLNMRADANKKEKVIPLDQYQIVWLGKQKGKKMHRFQLKAKNQKEKGLIYKNMWFGDQSEESAKSWFDLIKKLIEGKIMIQDDFNKKQQVLEVQNPITTDKKQEEILKSEKIKMEVSLQAPDDSEELKSLEENFKIMNIQEHNVNQPYYIPYSSMCQKIVQMPGKKSEEQLVIEKLAQAGPTSMQQNAIQMMTWFAQTKGFDYQNQIQMQYNFLEEHINLLIFQDKVNKNMFRAVFLCKTSPMQLFEEIQVPQTIKHWHPMIVSYEIFPSEKDRSSIVRKQINFFRKQGQEIVKKTIFFHRFSFSYKKAYFIISKTLENEYTDEPLKDKFTVFIKLFTHPVQNDKTVVSVDLQLNIDSEIEQDVRYTAIQYLKGYTFLTNNLIQNQALESKSLIVEVKQKQSTYDTYSQNHFSIKEDDDLSQNINIRIDYSKKDRKLTTVIGNYENEESKHQLLELLQKIEKNVLIIDCITNYHELGFTTQEEKRVKSTPENGHFCWKHCYKRDPQNGGLNFYNDTLMAEQRKVVVNLIKRVGSNILQGKSIMNISMPVSIFEPKSFLQRMARGFSHAPDFLKKGGETTNIVEQIKWTASYFMASFIMGMMQEKPFNPVLGETVQGRINGYPIYVEQICHHPPILSYIHYGPGYKLYGSHAVIVSMSPNSLYGDLKGNAIVEFYNTKKKFYFIWFPFMLYNVVVGQRYINAVYRCFTFEPESRLACEIILNPNDKGIIGNLFNKKNYKIDEFSGAIYKVKPDFLKQLQQFHKYNQGKEKKKIAIDPKNDVEEYVSKCEGIWHNHIKFDGQLYWDGDNDFPYLLEYEANPLPSDSRFRQDVIYLQMGDKKNSQDWKEKIEHMQRHDNKLREKKK